MNEFNEEMQRFLNDLDQDTEKQFQQISQKQEYYKEINIKQTEELKRCYNIIEDLQEKIRKMEQEISELKHSKEKELFQTNKTDISLEKSTDQQINNPNIQRNKRKREPNNVRDTNKKPKINEERDEELEQIVEILNKPVKKIEKIKILQPKENGKLSEMFLEIDKLRGVQNTTSSLLIKGYYNFGKIIKEQKDNLRKKMIGERKIKTEIINQIEKEIQIARENVIRRINKAEILYHLFDEIGKERIDNVKALITTKILNLNMNEIEFIIKNIKN